MRFMPSKTLAPEVGAADAGEARDEGIRI